MRRKENNEEKGERSCGESACQRSFLFDSYVYINRDTSCKERKKRRFMWSTCNTISLLEKMKPKLKRTM
uniref:Uncharacterized protein n=1 Tax=Setaria digitata TaxID=48799 RepID=A0A915PIL7_9BILA